METNKFFKFLWRANAVFLAVAGALMIGLLLTAFSFVIADSGSSDAPPPTASTEVEQNQEKEAFKLRAPSRGYNRNKVEGFAYFELRTGTDSYGKLSSGSSSQLRNVAVFDLDADTTHWVFPDAGQEIEKFESILKKIHLDDKNSKTITTGFLLTVAKSLPDRSISRDLWVMTTDGKNLEKVLSDISSSPDIAAYGDNQTKLIIETKTHIDVYPFDVNMLTVGAPTRVSIP